MSASSSDQLSGLSEEPTVISPNDDLTAPNICPLELLPRELVWELIDYAPECVLDLRLTSRIIESHVYAYAQQHHLNMTLIEKLVITAGESMRFPGKNELPVVKIFMLFKTNRPNILILRLRLRSHFEQIKTSLRKIGLMNGAIVINVLEDDTDLLNFIGKCANGRIDTLVVDEYHGKHINVIREICKGTYCRQIEATFDNCSDVTLSDLVKLVKSCKAEEVSLGIAKCTASNTVEILIELASVIRSFHITQWNAYGVDESSRYLLGVYNADWAQIIIDMLSKNIDKLCIDNPTFPEYITSDGVKLLTERLPNIGKKIWLKVSCNKYENDINYIYNANFVRANGGLSPYSYLKIKHVSRVKESNF